MPEPGQPVKIVKPDSPYKDRRGVVVRDAGLAEHGPDAGKRFWTVNVDGTVWSSPLMYREDELEET